MSSKRKPGHMGPLPPPAFSVPDTGDIPLVCTASGLIVVAERVGAENYEPSLAGPGLRRFIAEKGVAARIRGRGCVACGRPGCEYRPLQGPLFVPR